VLPEDRLPTAERYCQQFQESRRVSKSQGDQEPEQPASPSSSLVKRPGTHDALVRREKPVLPEVVQAKQTGSQTTINGISSSIEVFTRQGPRPSESYTDMQLVLTLHLITSSSGISETFPCLTQATSATPIGQACLMTSTCRGEADPCTCVFILNSPYVRTQHDITEAGVRDACQKAGFSKYSHVTRQTHSVFVVFFPSKYEASQARKNALLEFPSVVGTSTLPTGLSVRPEAHFLEMNSVFFFEAQPGSVNHETSCQRVFEALKGPLDSSILLCRQEITRDKSASIRTRYILRPYEAVCPIFVERFYVPLDAASVGGKVRAIFKPYYRGWICPACGERCQSGDESFAALLLCCWDPIPLMVCPVIAADYLGTRILTCYICHVLVLLAFLHFGDYHSPPQGTGV
jgi:hypothetical protein